MTALLFAAMAAAGGAGACARFALDSTISRRVRTVFPWATFTINFSGSLALGMLTALAAGRLLDPAWALVLGTGFLGGYTTFSTASYETVRLLGEKRYAASLANAVGALAACTGAAALGWWLGTLLTSPPGA